MSESMRGWLESLGWTPVGPESYQKECGSFTVKVEWVGSIRSWRATFSALDIFGVGPSPVMALERLQAKIKDSIHTQRCAIDYVGEVLAASRSGGAET